MFKKSKKECPFCKPDYNPFDPYRESQCTLNKPLWMVIPPGGVHLECPVHPDGHHVFGSQVSFMESKPWCEYTDDPSKHLTMDSSRQFADYDSTRKGSFIGTGSPVGHKQILDVIGKIGISEHDLMGSCLSRPVLLSRSK